MKLRIAIAIYNIHKWVSLLGNRPRVHALKQTLTQMESDVFFLQEVQDRHDLLAARHAAHWPDQLQHDFLAGDSHHAAYGMNAVYDQGYHGNALLSRFEIVLQSNQDVSEHAYEARGILHCVLKTGIADIHCYAVHLGLFGGGRRRQTAALIEAVRSSSPPDTPLIIAGDLNGWGNRLTDLLRMRLNVAEIFDEHIATKGVMRGVGSYFQQLMGGRTPKLKPARTFPAAFPRLRLDRIYLRGFTVESAEVLHGAEWVKLSDHAPILATLKLL